MRNIEAQVLEYLIERNWNNPRPADIAKSICIEAAELLEIFQWTSLSLTEAKRDGKLMGEIKKELADVFIYAFNMSVLLDLDTEQIIKEKIKQVKKKYPAELMKISKPDVNPEYLKIKNNYRQDNSS